MFESDKEGVVFLQTFLAPVCFRRPVYIRKNRTHVCVSGGAFGRVLEERPNSGPVEVAQQLDASRVEIAVRRHRAEEVGVGGAIREQGVSVSVGDLQAHGNNNSETFENYAELSSFCAQMQVFTRHGLCGSEQGSDPTRKHQNGCVFPMVSE